MNDLNIGETLKLCAWVLSSLRLNNPGFSLKDENSNFVVAIGAPMMKTQFHVFFFVIKISTFFFLNDLTKIVNYEAYHWRLLAKSQNDYKNNEFLKSKSPESYEKGCKGKTVSKFISIHICIRNGRWLVGAKFVFPTSNTRIFGALKFSNISLYDISGHVCLDSQPKWPSFGCQVCIAFAAEIGFIWVPSLSSKPVWNGLDFRCQVSLAITYEMADETVLFFGAKSAL